MHIISYIYFDKPGEKKKLKDIMESDLAEMEKVSRIQTEFNLDLAQAFEVCTVYKEKFAKPE